MRHSVLFATAFATLISTQTFAADLPGKGIIIKLMMFTMFFQGGMIPKAECCRNAIEWGVRRVFIIDGRVPHAILIEMLTNEGIGTMFTR